MVVPNAGVVGGEPLNSSGVSQLSRDAEADTERVKLQAISADGGEAGRVGVQGEIVHREEIIVGGSQRENAPDADTGTVKAEKITAIGGEGGKTPDVDTETAGSKTKMKKGETSSDADTEVVKLQTNVADGDEGGKILDADMETVKLQANVAEGGEGRKTPDADTETVKAEKIIVDADGGEGGEKPEADRETAGRKKIKKSGEGKQKSTEDTLDKRREKALDKIGLVFGGCSYLPILRSGFFVRSFSNPVCFTILGNLCSSITDWKKFQEVSGS